VKQFKEKFLSLKNNKKSHEMLRDVLKDFIPQTQSKVVKTTKKTCAVLTTAIVPSDTAIAAPAFVITDTNSFAIAAATRPMNEYISDEDMFAFICEYDEPAAIRTDVIDEEEEEEEEDVDLTLLFDVRAEDDDEFEEED
jgi:hypothetical protein